MTDQHKIKTLFEKTYPEHVKARDIAGYSRMYTCDALWSPPNVDSCRGPEEIAAGFAKQIANIDIDPVFTAEEIKIFDDTAYVLGTSTATVTAHADQSVKQVRFSALWIVSKNSAGEWLIARQLWNNKP